MISEPISSYPGGLDHGAPFLKQTRCHDHLVPFIHRALLLVWAVPLPKLFCCPIHAHPFPARVHWIRGAAETESSVSSCINAAKTGRQQDTHTLWVWPTVTPSAGPRPSRQGNAPTRNPPRQEVQLFMEMKPRHTSQARFPLNISTSVDDEV